jgi:L-iditol 2-dehydrogenase
MVALQRRGDTVALVELPVPHPAPDEVVVRVRAAGICRTDVAVARGELPSADPVVLGHELAGEVVAAGDGHGLGQRVSADPWRLGAQLGVHADGAFAPYLRLHRSQLVPLDDHVDWTVGAYVEPVAAALGVLDASPRGEVLVLGSGRIAELTARVLRAATDCTVRVATAAPTDSADVVIEARPAPGVLARALDIVRPRGTVVLKSRADVSLSLPLALAVRKRASLVAVGHGDFARAAALLASGELPLEGLLGDSHPLAAWREAFARGESRKTFLLP